MGEKFEIYSTVPVKSLILSAMKGKKTAYLKDLGWVYLAKWDAMRNPQTGFILNPPSVSKMTFVSEGQNGECKNDHGKFFDSQGLQIQEIEIPELADNQEVGKTYSVYDPEKTLAFSYSIMPKYENLLSFRKVRSFNLAKDLKREISSLPAFIEEVYDWKDLQTPEDTDNPHPRLLKLNLI